MAIYIITHKYLDKIVTKQGYKYLYVGAHKQTEKDKAYLFDDMGENISTKNSNYCELTGLYWIWKNSNEKYKGIAHYRRFFTKNSFSSKENYFYSERELNKILNKYDIVVGEKLYVPMKNVYEDYAKYHFERDIIQLKSVIENNYSDYLDAFELVFSRNYYCPANMLYCSAELFNRYCEWLFSVLEELEKKVDISKYNTEQARIYGFIGERLLNVWIEKNHLSKKEVRIIQTDSKFRLRIRKKLDILFKRAIKNESKYSK